MIYIMSDFHLPSSLSKTMEMFDWGNHVKKIEDNWPLKENDTIIMPGDLSWALKQNELKCDLEWLNNLPGKKILIKGNHDLWWDSKSKLDKLLSEFKTISYIHLNSIEIEDIYICGTRGWDINKHTDEDIKILEREKQRLISSITSCPDDKEKIVFLHFPPLLKTNLTNIYTDVFKEYDIKKVYYGHLHGKAIYDAIEGIYDGISYKCVAADQIQFKPIILTRDIES